MTKIFRQLKEAVEDLKNGKVGVGPSDTIYGIYGSAMKPEVVERIYALRARDPKKPMIILINKLNDLRLFGVSIGEREKNWLSKVWPGKVSVVLACRSERFAYLHRGKESLAFRLPDWKQLREVIKETGPLVAPSANPEGEPPAENVEQAKAYFGNKVDFYFERSEKEGSALAGSYSRVSENKVLPKAGSYVDGEDVKGKASTVVSLVGGKLEVLRQGEVQVPQL